MSPFRRRLAALLGMNARNALYVYRRNPVPALPFADDKLVAKEALRRAGVPVPETLAVVSSRREAHRIEKTVAPLGAFACKPARGSGGAGILLVRGRSPEGDLVAGGRPLPLDDLKHWLVDVLTGAFSGGRPDRAFLERLLVPHAELAGLSPAGLPDIRIITLEGKALLAMLRLPTEASGGRANLHQGGVGVGVDMDSGLTTGGWWKRVRREEHPDTQAPLAGLAVPFWSELVEIAERAAAAVPLGYLGVDLTVDQELGPVVLELNARPGLEVQNVTGRGLRALLETEP